MDYDSKEERNCYTAGRVYVYNENRGKNRGFLEGDLLLCIRKNGDCFYDFIHIKKYTETSYKHGKGKPSYPIASYFKLHNKISGYCGFKEAFPKMKTLSEIALVHILYSNQVLIPLLDTLSDEELEKLNKKWELESELLKL